MKISIKVELSLNKTEAAVWQLLKKKWKTTDRKVAYHLIKRGLKQVINEFEKALDEAIQNGEKTLE